MLQIILVVFATVNLLLTALVLFPLRQPSNFALWLTKVFISAMSPFLALLGLLLAVTGWLLQAWSILFLGTVAALIYFFHIITISTAPPRITDMTSAFGSSWINQIPPARKSRFLPGRYVLRLPAVPQPDFEQNLPYHTLPYHQRQLLCDIWQPPRNVKRSGVAFIYLHGSAWTVLDKDYGTRRFFRHLAAQGHVVMDVAYRLFPETDFTGMVQDALYAIAWMKTHAVQYKVDPDQLVIGGGSAGAHIAMLAAFTTHNNRFTPTDLLNTDLSVRAVVSLYGPTDLKAAYDHTRQEKKRRYCDAKMDAKKNGR